MPVQSSDPPRLVRVGIDAAVVAQHEVWLRVTEADGRVRVDRCHVPPTLPGLRSLTRRLAVTPGVMAVAEPTSARWAFRDVWNAFGGSLPTAVGCSAAGRILAQLAGARRPS